METKTDKNAVPTKVGMHDVSPGNISHMRIMITTYMWAINVPGSLALLSSLLYGVYKGAITDPIDILLLIVLFLFMQVTWIAPKVVSKSIEESGALTKVLSGVFGDKK